MISFPTIFRMADVSTAHMRPGDFAWADDEHFPCVGVREEGYLFVVSHDAIGQYDWLRGEEAWLKEWAEAENYSEEIARILWAAHWTNVDYILFDRDAPILEDVAVFEREYDNG